MKKKKKKTAVHTFARCILCAVSYHVVFDVSFPGKYTRTLINIYSGEFFELKITYLNDVCDLCLGCMESVARHRLARAKIQIRKKFSNRKEDQKEKKRKTYTERVTEL